MAEGVQYSYSRCFPGDVYRRRSIVSGRTTERVSPRCEHDTVPDIANSVAEPRWKRGQGVAASLDDAGGDRHTATRAGVSLRPAFIFVQQAAYEIDRGCRLFNNS